MSLAGILVAVDYVTLKGFYRNAREKIEIPKNIFD